MNEGNIFEPKPGPDTMHRLVMFPDELEVDRYRTRRKPEELKAILAEQERQKVKKDILDESGSKVCSIEIDSGSGRVISVACERFVNVEAAAEKPSERIYVTDGDGQITPDRLTRKEVRDQEKRYLIVTNIIFHGDDMLIQKRSPDKKIDPDKLSTSAHGVAKEVFSEDGKRIEDGQVAALINSALEINEELRHDAEPFQIRIWPGTHDELYDYVAAEKIDDSDTIWLVPEMYYQDNGYPLNDYDNRRTRAVSSGFIFSSSQPKISIDPNELQGCHWARVTEALQASEELTTDDLPTTVYEVMRRILMSSPYAKQYGPKFVDHLLDRWQGIPKERTD